LTNRDDLYTPKRVFLANDVPFGGLDNIWLHFRFPGLNLQITSPIWAGIAISQPNRRSRK